MDKIYWMQMRYLRYYFVMLYHICLTIHLYFDDFHLEVISELDSSISKLSIQSCEVHALIEITRSRGVAPTRPWVYTTQTVILYRYSWYANGVLSRVYMQNAYAIIELRLKLTTGLFRWISLLHVLKCTICYDREFVMWSFVN